MRNRDRDTETDRQTKGQREIDMRNRDRDTETDTARQ